MLDVAENMLSNTSNYVKKLGMASTDWTYLARSPRTFAMYLVHVLAGACEEPEPVEQLEGELGCRLLIG